MGRSAIAAIYQQQGGGSSYFETIDLSFGENNLPTSVATFLNTLNFSFGQTDVNSGRASYLESLTFSFGETNSPTISLTIYEVIELALNGAFSDSSKAEWVESLAFSSSEGGSSISKGALHDSADLSNNMTLIARYLQAAVRSISLDFSNTFTASGAILTKLKPGNLPPLIAAPQKGNGPNTGLNTPPLPAYSLGAAKTLVLASSNAGTAYAAGVSVPLAFTSSLDVLEEWNGDTFTARITGNYIFIYSVGMPSTGQPASANIQIQVNGKAKYNYPVFGIQAGGSVFGSTPLNLNAGDSVQVLFDPVSAFTSTTDPTTNFISIVRSL